MANELILIVEDNPKSLKLLRDTLQAQGYQTIEAETGEEGARVAHERQPPLILRCSAAAGHRARMPTELEIAA
jgi:two-component system, cell cycle response regulator DivK